MLATLKNFMVYAAPHALKGFAVEPDSTLRQAIEKIAADEGGCRPGSFNYRLIIGATDLGDAFNFAAKTRLEFEPLKTVWARHADRKKQTVNIVWARDPENAAFTPEALRQYRFEDVAEMEVPTEENSMREIQKIFWPRICWGRAVSKSPFTVVPAFN